MMDMYAPCVQTQTPLPSSNGVFDPAQMDALHTLLANNTEAVDLLYIRLYQSLYGETESMCCPSDIGCKLRLAVFKCVSSQLTKIDPSLISTDVTTRVRDLFRQCKDSCSAGIPSVYRVWTCAESLMACIDVYVVFVTRGCPFWLHLIDNRDEAPPNRSFLSLHPLRMLACVSTSAPRKQQQHTDSQPRLKLQCDWDHAWRCQVECAHDSLAAAPCDGNKQFMHPLCYIDCLYAAMIKLA
jgi:hypothetical protein